MIIKKLLLLLVGCMGMHAMHAMSPQRVDGRLEWPDGRESFQDLVEPKVESKLNQSIYKALHPGPGEILVSGLMPENTVSPQALLLSDKLKVPAPKRLRSIIDDAPPILRLLPDDILQEYICPAMIELPIPINLKPTNVGSQSHPEVSYLNCRDSKIKVVDPITKEVLEYVGCNYALSENNKWLVIYGLCGDAWQSGSYIYLIDMKTKKICGNSAHYFLRYDEKDTYSAINFSRDQLSIELREKSYYIGGMYTDSSMLANNNCFYDLSILEDSEIKRIIDNKLTLEQSMLLGYLVEIQQKNNNGLISLLKDICNPRVLVLRELQAILASLPPVIQESIIKKFNIVDATEKDALVQKAKREERKQWIDQVKKMGAASAIAVAAAITAWFTK